MVFINIEDARERSNGVHAHVHMCVVKGVQEQMSVNGVRVQMFVCS